MRPLLLPLKRILLQVLLLLGVYFLCRCAFAAINAKHFSGLGFSGFLRIAFYGLRYDLSAIFAVNAIYILLLLLPVPIWHMRVWEKITQWIFILINSIALLFEIGDWPYFPYNFKRSTAGVLKLVGRKGDFLNVLPSYLATYWYLPLVAILFIYLFKKVNDRIRKATPLNERPQIKSYLVIGLAQIVRLGIAAGVCVLAIRGGFQYIPIGLRNAVQVTDSKYVPIVLNTPFSILTTLQSQGLEEIHYMPDAQAASLIPVVKNYSGRPLRKMNVVVIMLESFSKEFTKLGGGKSYTPFLDSLMDHSLVCTQGYANGLHSAEGIPAIIAGIPTLMDEAFPTSDYGTNRINALPSLLKGAGYSSAFYHGGTNGTMSFDIFATAAGYQHYYGRKEYNNERDYDGAWGIWDEPFLQYFANHVGDMPQPFFASVFTLSSHPPYGLPKQYVGKFAKGTLAIHPTVQYTDDALRKLFATAAKQPWYSNTIFVITADHAAPEKASGYWETAMGQYAIPILFYAPGDSAIKGTYGNCVQQIDIMPSIMDYLGWNAPFFAFGNSIFRKEANRFVVNWISGDHYWLQTGWLLQAHEAKPFGLYHFSSDSACSNNILGKYGVVQDSLLVRLRAFVQVYRNALIHNRMTVESQGMR